MEWLKLAELDEGIFSLEYWPTGKTKDVRRSFLSELRMRSFDTSFHIIKAGEFAKVYNGPDTKELARVVVGKVWECWVENLRLSDKRGVSVWPHYFPKLKEVAKEFRLSDQLWIWKALSIVEETKISPPSDPDSRKMGATAVIFAS
jgi:predicted metalloendopeptidase